MKTIVVALKILLSFCENTEFEYMCKYELRTCFNENIERRISVDESFRRCLDNNYERLIYEKE